jgi:superfamily II DNA/RNA helicase
MALGDYMDITCHACIGGGSVRDEMRLLESGVQIVVGTPGRVFDMINRSALRKSSRVDTDFDFLMLNIFRYQAYKNACNG